MKYGLILRIWMKWIFGKELCYRWEKAINLPCPKISDCLEPTYDNCIKYKSGADAKKNTFYEERPGVLRPTQNQDVVLDKSDTASDTASEEDGGDTAIERKQLKRADVIIPHGLTGLNRAEMERERLERLKRSKKPSPEPQSVRSAKKAKFGTTPPNISLLHKVHSETGLQYPDGTIKWTYAVGYPKEQYHITIEEVLQKDSLKAAVLSGFQVCLQAN
jgi:hypothetical protein